MVIVVYVVFFDGLCYLRWGYLSSSEFDYKSKVKCKGLYVKIIVFWK